MTVKLENSAVGVIQFGGGNTATVGSVTLGPDQSEKLRGVLRLISQLSGAESTSLAEKELCEVAVEAESELAKPESNWTRVVVSFRHWFRGSPRLSR